MLRWNLLKKLSLSIFTPVHFEITKPSSLWTRACQAYFTSIFSSVSLNCSTHSVDYVVQLINKSCQLVHTENLLNYLLRTHLIEGSNIQAVECRLGIHVYKAMIHILKVKYSVWITWQNVNYLTFIWLATLGWNRKYWN